MSPSFRDPVQHEGFKAGMERCSAAVHNYTERFFAWLAGGVVGHPGLTIAAVCLFTGIMAQGVWFYEEELSGDKLFTPRGSRAVSEEDWVVDHFGYEDRPVAIMFEAVGGSMVTREGLLYMLSAHEWFLSQWLMVDGRNTTYEVVCARYTPNDTCKDPDSVLSLWSYNRTLLLADPDPLATINSADPPLTFGDPTYSPTAQLLSATASRIEYLLKNEKETISGIGEDDPESRYFEIMVAEESAVKRKRDLADTGIGLYVLTDGEAETAGDGAMEDDVTNLMIGYALMICYTTVILARSRPKYSHSIIGLVSVVSVGMSTFSAYGLCWFMGVKFNTIVQVLVLVLLGVGVDDTFVIMDSWWDCADITDMKERMVAALRHAGPAITITSVTDLIAFLAGSSTVLPALRDFCYYAAVGIAFDFAFQVTFVVAVIYLDSVRQEESRADVLCCIKVGDHTGICVGDTETWSESQKGIQDKIVGTYLPRLTLGTIYGKVGVVLLSLVWLGIGIYGCTKVTMNHNSEWFIPEGHAYRKAMRVRDTYFGGNELPANAYLGDINYPVEQGTVLRAAEALRENKWVVENSTTSWMEDFQEWVRSDHGADWDAAGRRVVPSEFYRLLKLYASTRTGPRSAWQHIDNIRWNATGGVLSASRVGFRIVGDTQTNGEDAVDAMGDLRSALDGVAFPWAAPFVFWEAFKIMVAEITRNVAIAGSCVFVLVTVMLANIPMGLLVTLSIGCVDVCMMGFMPFVGVDLNGISVVCILLAVGLSVDYSVHIAGAFLHKACDDDDEHYTGRTQRAAYALWKMGPAVVNGGTSTFLAIMPAGFALSYGFNVFFRMFSLIIFFGQWFGVLLLPVILSWVGPDARLDAPSLQQAPRENPLCNSTPKTAPGLPMQEVRQQIV